MADYVDVRPGAYYDSVTLMLVSRTLTDRDDVVNAIVAMGTELNLALLAEAGFDVSDVSAADLVLAVRATDPAAAIAEADAQLAAATGQRSGAKSEGPAPRSIRSAADGANVALISVPGEHAYREASDALEAGLHVVLYSDNVSVDAEVELKARAAERGLLVMGPDCGTVILAGAGLGFANVVAPGPIGLVSASGTGAQQVCALCDAADVGVRHVIGLGGRDLTDAVGGASALPALRLLDADPAIEAVGIIAKEIGPETQGDLDTAVAQLSTPVVTVGLDDLTAGTAELLRSVDIAMPEPRSWSPSAQRPKRDGILVGLYSGGTLALEATRIASGVVHDIVDLGADEFTRGRPHPMIDYRMRLDRLADSASAGAIVLDVVLGHAAHPDPAAELAPVVADLSVPVFASLIGTRDDPQGLESQAAALAGAGASVHVSNAAAVREAIA